MAPELRKRKALAQPAPPPPAKKKTSPKPKAAEPTKGKKVTTPPKETQPEKSKSPVNGKDSVKPAASTPAKVGDVVDLDGFGGEVETHDGKKVTLKQLVDESKAGVVLFTYPKALTPGCTKQACLFRDSYEPLTAGGLAIYGLSADTPKENAKFKEKKDLPYALLCDPKATLLAAISLKKGPGKAARGVFVIDKTGKVLAGELGSPDKTLDIVKGLLAETNGAAKDAVDKVEKAKEVVEGKKDGAGKGESEKKEEKKAEKEEMEAGNEKKEADEEKKAEKEEKEEKEAKEKIEKEAEKEAEKKD
ncbi:hypothetical protein PpBr36_02415 [Pyricularia pennisetigena]|uniref:hypothetical protein n=1 Tax=Pyricularia pennisetigena TaxID=1578925 RepID=UPI001151A01A|nr:hypothetical protein PpBr36_02415 [Pyricularia pennisetigena]TLS31174.1 hypothetical protein PpBr36_02415 [Pyricularia pennisetigena]